MQSNPEKSHKGIVLRSFDSGESSVVFHILSTKGEKFSAIAKGIKNSKKRFLGKLEVFDVGTFKVKEGRGSLDILLEFSPDQGCFHMREDFEKLILASLLLESFDYLIHDTDLEEGELIYHLLHEGLQDIDGSTNLKETFKACYLTLTGLLKITGYFKPDFNNAPSKNNLLSLLNYLEECADRQLKCKHLVVQILNSVHS